ncbi:MAG: hypothetical protein GY714_18215 [Desulfobacterales bacterium]|nr:hypothetical protein [Desulfobacterales bacterium]
MKYIVELEEGVYIAPWDGDPGRTHVKENATRFKNISLAYKAISKAFECRNFNNPRVIEES